METVAQSITQDSVNAILTRLREVLSEENALLESGVSHDHQRFIASKNEILRDLIICSRSLPRLAELSAVREQFNGVRKLVDRNHALLQSHVEAMTELTTLLTEVEISEDADGTYQKDKL